MNGEGWLGGGREVEPKQSMVGLFDISYQFFIPSRPAPRRAVFFEGSCSLNKAEELHVDLSTGLLELSVRRRGRGEKGVERSNPGTRSQIITRIETWL